MVDWWTEEWSFGTGPSRTYCGIARTEEGFAVDVFQGDTCLASEVYDTRRQASRAASDLRTRYGRARSVPAPDEVLAL